METALRYSKSLVKHGKVKQISETLFQVENHSVKFQTKPGRTLLICDCCNDTNFCNESPFCVHKLSVINYLMDKTFYKELDKIIEMYSNWKDMKLPVKIDCILADLQNLREIR